MDLGLAGKTAIVAASSKGLGKACALALAAEGAHLTVCARGEADLHAAAAEIRQATGAQVLAVPADLSTAAGRRVRRGGDHRGVRRGGRAGDQLRRAPARHLR